MEIMDIVFNGTDNLFESFHTQGDGAHETFLAPFAPVNAEVYHKVSLFCERNNITPSRDDSVGVTQYALPLRMNLSIRIFVKNHGDSRTRVSTHLYTRNEARLTSEEFYSLVGLITSWNIDIMNILRKADSQYTLHPTDSSPPMPPMSEGWESIFSWQARFAREWTDTELAAALNVSKGTVSNARTREGATRTKRGRPKKG